MNCIACSLKLALQPDLKSTCTMTICIQYRTDIDTITRFGSKLLAQPTPNDFPQSRHIALKYSCSLAENCLLGQRCIDSKSLL